MNLIQVTIYLSASTTQLILVRHENGDTRTVYFKIDGERNYVKHLAVSHSFEFRAINSSNFFCVDDYNHKVWVYSNDLVDTQNHITSNIPYGVNGIQANDKRLFIMYSDEALIRVIGLESKTVQKEIRLPSTGLNQFKFISSDYLVVFNNQDKEFYLINSYNFSVNKLDRNVVGLAENLTMSRDNSSYLIFYNTRELISYCLIQN